MGGWGRALARKAPHIRMHPPPSHPHHLCTLLPHPALGPVSGGRGGEGRSTCTRPHGPPPAPTPSVPASWRPCAGSRPIAWGGQHHQASKGRRSITWAAGSSYTAKPLGHDRTARGHGRVGVRVTDTGSSGGQWGAGDGIGGRLGAIPTPARSTPAPCPQPWRHRAPPAPLHPYTPASQHPCAPAPLHLALCGVMHFQRKMQGCCTPRTSVSPSTVPGPSPPSTVAPSHVAAGPSWRGYGHPPPSPSAPGTSSDAPQWPPHTCAHAGLTHEQTSA